MFDLLVTLGTFAVLLFGAIKFNQWQANLQNISNSKIPESFYRNHILKEHIKDSIETFFTAKKPVLKSSETYSLNIQIDKSQMVVCLSKTNCDRSQEGLPKEEQPVKITNNAPRPRSTSGGNNESATPTISDKIAPTTIMHNQSVVFSTIFMSKENAPLGFGDPKGNFWIGFDKLNSLMGDQRHVLYIEHTLDDGSKHHATYDDFRLGWDGRGIKSLGKYSGSLKDGLRDFVNQPPRSPPWILSVCMPKLDSRHHSKSTVVRISHVDFNP